MKPSPGGTTPEPVPIEWVNDTAVPSRSNADTWVVPGGAGRSPPAERGVGSVRGAQPAGVGHGGQATHAVGRAAAINRQGAALAKRAGQRVRHQCEVPGAAGAERPEILALQQFSTWIRNTPTFGNASVATVRPR